jgi:hypothetical protein
MSFLCEEKSLGCKNEVTQADSTFLRDEIFLRHIYLTTRLNFVIPRNLRLLGLVSSTRLPEFARRRLASSPRFTTTLLPGYKCEPLYYSWPDDPRGDVKKT